MLCGHVCIRASATTLDCNQEKVGTRWPLESVICMAYVHFLIMIELLICKPCLSVDYKPPIIMYPVTVETLYYPERGDFTIECIAEGEPKPRYKWIHNGTDISETEGLTIDEHKGRLTCESFRSSHQGQYRCIATNEHVIDEQEDSVSIEMSSMSAIIQLLQIRLEEFTSSESITKVATEYTYTSLLCGHKHKSVAKEIIYEWQDAGTKQKLNMENGRLYIDINERSFPNSRVNLFMSSRRNLHFTYTLITDGERSGYVCVIQTVVSPGVRLFSQGTTIVLKVSSRSKEKVQPQIAYRSTKVTARRLSNITLECLFSGYDPDWGGIPSQTWRDEDNRLFNTTSSKYKMKSDRRQLIITNVLEEDETTYYCFGTNTLGTSSSSVTLDVTSGPIFLRPIPPLGKVVENSDFIFSCEARSTKGEKPPGEPVFYINSNLLDENTVAANRFHVTEGHKILAIKNIKGPADFMCVQCDVSNHVDIAVANTCIDGFTVPISFLRRPPSRQEIVYGDRVDLTVQAIGDPSSPVRYRWRLNEELIEDDKPPPHVYFNPMTSEAYIYTDQLTENEYKTIGGFYDIVVYNLYDSKSATTEVVLKDIKNQFLEFLSQWRVFFLVFGILAVTLLNAFIAYKIVSARHARAVTKQLSKTPSLIKDKQAEAVQDSERSDTTLQGELSETITSSMETEV